MKRLWLRGSNCVSNYHAGKVKHTIVYEVDGEPAPMNKNNEVLLVEGLVRIHAFCLVDSQQVQWQAAELVQQLGGFYFVREVARGDSFISASEYSDGALAACEIAAERRKANYQPYGEPRHVGSGRKASKSAAGRKSTSRAGTNNKKLVDESRMQGVFDIFKSNAKG